MAMLSRLRPWTCLRCVVRGLAAVRRPEQRQVGATARDRRAAATTRVAVRTDRDASLRTVEDDVETLYRSLADDGPAEVFCPAPEPELPAKLRRRLGRECGQADDADYIGATAQIRDAGGLARCGVADANALLRWVPVEFRRHVVDGVLGMMDRSGIAPDRQTLHLAMDAYVSVGLNDQAVRLMRTIANGNGRGFEPNPATFVLLLKGCAQRKEDLGRLMGLLDAMKQYSLRPTTIHYSIAMNACRKAGAYQQAWDMWTVMKYMSAETAPDEVAYHHALLLCGRQKNAEKALDLWQEMSDRNIPAKVYHLNALAYACATRQEYYLEAWKHAGEILKTCNPLVTCNILLGACGRNGDVRAARAIFGRILEGTDSGPDATSFMGLFRSYATFKPKALAEKVAFSTSQTRDVVAPRKWRRHVQNLMKSIDKTVLLDRRPSQMQKLALSDSLDLTTVWTEAYVLFDYLTLHHANLVDTQMVNAFFDIAVNHHWPRPDLFLDNLYAMNVERSCELGERFIGPPFSEGLQVFSAYQPPSPDRYTFLTAMRAARDQMLEGFGQDVWERYTRWKRNASPDGRADDGTEKEIYAQLVQLHARLEKFDTVEELLRAQMGRMKFSITDLLAVHSKAQQAELDGLKDLVEAIWKDNGEVDDRSKAARWTAGSERQTYSDAIRARLTKTASMDRERVA